ncbi:MAG: alanine racemase [Vampirovibrionales bacterium]|nr:alanine racemase [Vampirovibrionales bacterium]
MKLSRQLPQQSRRDAWVTIDLDALEHNARTLQAGLPKNISAMAVVKADAYGHGAVMVIPTLLACGFTSFGVASADEAMQIRDANISAPVLILGPTPDWAMPTVISHNIQLTVFDAHHLDSLASACHQTGLTAQVHVKIDTGMHRIGVPWQEARAFIEKAHQTPGVQVQGIFSHLANAEKQQPTQLQLAHWHHVLEHIDIMPPLRHLANSSGVWQTGTSVLDAKYHTNMVRLGIGLFGYGAAPTGQKLRAVMGLKARVVHLQKIQAKTGVSYGHAFVAQRPTTLATLPLGYADGIPRRLSGQLHAVLQGQAIPQVGVITMDQMMVDVTDLQDVHLGDTVTLLGRPDWHEPTLADWARLSNTIEYELMCALRVRLPRTYIRTGLGV